MFGLKPTRGRISTLPDREHWHGLRTFYATGPYVTYTAVWNYLG